MEKKKLKILKSVFSFRGELSRLLSSHVVYWIGSQSKNLCMFFSRNISGKEKVLNIQATKEGV
jgi:hypothetical protein